MLTNANSQNCVWDIKHASFMVGKMLVLCQAFEMICKYVLIGLLFAKYYLWTFWSFFQLLITPELNYQIKKQQTCKLYKQKNESKIYTSAERRIIFSPVS